MIQGVEIRDYQVNADERGHLAEILRENWDSDDEQPAVASYSMTYPGIPDEERLPYDTDRIPLDWEAAPHE